MCLCCCCFLCTWKFSKVCLAQHTLCCWKEEECLTVSVVSVFLYHHSCHVHVQLHIYLSVCLCVFPSNKIVNIYASNSNRFLRCHTDFVLCYTTHIHTYLSVFIPRNVPIWLYPTYICVSCFKTSLTCIYILAFAVCFHDFIRSFWNLLYMFEISQSIAVFSLFCFLLVRNLSISTTTKKESHFNLSAVSGTK